QQESRQKELLLGEPTPCRARPQERNGQAAAERQEHGNSASHGGRLTVDLAPSVRLIDRAEAIRKSPRQRRQKQTETEAGSEQDEQCSQVAPDVAHAQRGHSC